MGDHSISKSVQEVIKSFSALILSEIHLARAEAKQNIRDASRNVGLTVGFGCLVGLGALLLLAAGVIGLGEVLGGNYWLSSLLFGLVLSFGGGIMALRSAQRIKKEDALLYSSRSIETDRKLIQREIQQLKEASNPPKIETREKLAS